MFLFNLAQYSNSTPITIRTKKSAQSSRWSTPFELVPVFITWSHLELIASDHILDELLLHADYCTAIAIYQFFLCLTIYYWLMRSSVCKKYLSRTQNPITLYILKSVCIFSILFSIHVLRCRQGEFVQELLYVVIISSILMTLMCDSGVILYREIRW